MKKIFLIITLILLIGMGVYAFYEKYYPKIVAKAVIDEKYAKVLPEKYAKQLAIISDTVNSKLDEVISITSAEGIGFHQLEAAVLEIQRKDVELIYEKLKKN